MCNRKCVVILFLFTIWPTDIVTNESAPGIFNLMKNNTNTVFLLNKQQFIFISKPFVAEHPTHSFDNLFSVFYQSVWVEKKRNSQNFIEKIRADLGNELNMCQNVEKKNAIAGIFTLFVGRAFFSYSFRVRGYGQVRKTIRSDSGQQIRPFETSGLHSVFCIVTHQRHDW